MIKNKIFVIALVTLFAGYLFSWFLSDNEQSTKISLNPINANSINSDSSTINKPTYVIEKKPTAVSSQIKKTKVVTNELKNNINSTKSYSAHYSWDKLFARFKNGDWSANIWERNIILSLRKGQGKANGKDLYSDWYNLFATNELTDNSKQLVISILGVTATPESAQLLYKLINNNLINNKDLKISTIKAINKFATEQWQDEPNYKIASIMESEWPDITDQNILQATAKSLAKIGRLSTLDLFAKELKSSNVIDSNKDIVIQKVMHNIRNEDLIDQLSINIKNYQHKLLQNASGEALANIATVKSTRKMLDWSANALYSDLPRLKKWFGTAVNRSPSVISVLAKELPNKKFDTAEIKSALENILNKNQVN